MNNGAPSSCGRTSHSSAADLSLPTTIPDSGKSTANYCQPQSNPSRRASGIRSGFTIWKAKSSRKLPSCLGLSVRLSAADLRLRGNRSKNSLRFLRMPESFNSCFVPNEKRECPVGRVYKVFLMKKISQPTNSGADCDIPRKKNLYVIKCAVGHSPKNHVVDI